MPYVKENFPFIESGGPQKRLEHLNYLFKMCVCVCGGWGVYVCVHACWNLASHICVCRLVPCQIGAQEAEGKTGGRKGDLLLLILLPIPASVLTEVVFHPDDSSLSLVVPEQLIAYSEVLVPACSCPAAAFS